MTAEVESSPSNPEAFCLVHQPLFWIGWTGSRLDSDPSLRMTLGEECVQGWTNGWEGCLEILKEVDMRDEGCIWPWCINTATNGWSTMDGYIYLQDINAPSTSD